MNATAVTVPVPRAVEDSTSSSKALVGLLVLLAVLLSALGAASFWLFRSIDGDYNRLITRVTEDLNSVQDIEFNSLLGYVRVSKLPSTENPQAQAAMLRTIADQRLASDRLFGNLKSASSDPEVLAALNEVMARRTLFRKTMDDFISSSQVADAAHAEAPDLDPVLTAFVDYHRACQQLTDQIAEKHLESGREVAQKVRLVSLVFLWLGILPIAVAVVLVLLVAYLIQATPPEVDLS